MGPQRRTSDGRVICEPPGPWNPGQQSGFSPRSPNMAYPSDMPPMPGTDSYGNPCSPVTGIDTRYYIETGRAPLTREVVGTTIPVLFEPINAAVVSDGWITVAERIVPSGFHGRYARVRAHLEGTVEWTQAVEWVIRTGSGGMMIEEPWRGEVSDPNWVNLKDKSNPGRVFRLDARIHPDFWWSSTNPGVPVGPCPVTSLLVGVAWFELLCVADSAPCGPAETLAVPH